MGIVRVYPLGSFTYQCVCGNQIAYPANLKDTKGECWVGGLFSFTIIHNFYRGEGLQIQISTGEDVFLVDDYPIRNKEMKSSEQLHCKVCSRLMGWYIIELDIYLCFKDRLFYK